MFWLTFLFLSLALYLPPLDLAQQIYRWATRQIWVVPILMWPLPAWFAYFFWLTVAFLSLGTLLHLLARRLPADNGVRVFAVRVSQADLGGATVVAAGIATLIIPLVWPLLPLARWFYGWTYALSTPVAALAALSLLAEALRMAEGNVWADLAYAARRQAWLVEHGYADA